MEELSNNEVEKAVRSLTNIGKDDPLDSRPIVAPYDTDHPIPEGHIFTECYPPHPETVVALEKQGVMRDSDGEETSVASANSTRQVEVEDEAEAEDSEEHLTRRPRKHARESAEQSADSKDAYGDAQGDAESAAAPENVVTGAGSAAPIGATPLRALPPVSTKRPRAGSRAWDMDSLIDLDQEEDLDMAPPLPPATDATPQDPPPATGADLVEPTDKEVADLAAKDKEGGPVPIVRDWPSSSSEHPMIRTLLDVGERYVQMESELEVVRGQLREARRAASLAEEVKADALRRAEMLDKALESARKDSVTKAEEAAAAARAESKKREDDMRAQTAERDMRVVLRLRSLASALSGASTSARVEGLATSLNDAVAAVEAASRTTQVLIGKATAALSALHEHVFPKKTPPTELGELAEIFRPESTSLEEHDHSQTTGPAETPAVAALDSLLPQDKEHHFEFLRTRCKEAERNAMEARATAAIIKSKKMKAEEREAFLLGELSVLSEQLRCIQVDERAESDRLKWRLNALFESVSTGASTFWSDRARSQVLVLLQDRVNQVASFAESCQSALTLVHQALFPLNMVPQGLAALMDKFRRGEAIKEFVCEQLIGGAKVALAFV